MKKLYLLVAASLFVVNSAFSQKIFPDTFAIWHEHIENLEDPGDQSVEEYSYIMQGDTQLKGNKYKIIYNTSTEIKKFTNGHVYGPYTVYSNSKFVFTRPVGGVRKDGKKLYYIDFSHNTEKLAYDYSLKTTDSVIQMLGLSVYKLKDSTIVGHRYMEIQNFISNPTPGSINYIIEGMGYNRAVLPTKGISQHLAYVTFFCGDGISYIGNPLGKGSWSPVEVTSNCKKGLSAFLSVDEKTGQSITAYPNPATNYVVVNNLFNNSLLTIIDISGRLLKEHESTNTSETIDISALPQGVYILLISNESGVSSRRIVKQ